MNQLFQSPDSYRNLPDAAMSQRDLTHAEAEALAAHRAVLAKVRSFVAEMLCMRSGAYHLSSHLTETCEIAEALSDYARVLDSECARIDAGEALS